METDAAVGGRDDVAALAAPRLDHAVDRAAGRGRGRRRARRRRLRRSRGSAASPQRSEAPGPALPVRAVHRVDACVDVERMRPGDDEHAVERGARRSAASTCGSSSCCFGGDDVP